MPTKLKDMVQRGSPDWMDQLSVNSGKDRSSSNMDPSQNTAIVSTTHRDPEPAMDPNEDKTK